MDPTEIACRVYNTFKKKKPDFDPQNLPQHFSTETPVPLTFTNKSKTIITFFGDSDFYENLQLLKIDILYESERSITFGSALMVADPFLRIGESVFGNKNSIILANIDAIYKLTGHYSTLLKQRLDMTFEKVGLTSSPAYENPVGLFERDIDFIACSINDIEGGFTNYLQFRLKNLISYGMNSKEESWNVSKLSTKFLNITYGNDGTGDLWSNWQYFIDMIRGRVIGGVQLMVANGGSVSLGARHIKEDVKSETENNRTILQEALVGLGCCGARGNVVIKVFGTFSAFTADLLYVLAQCFEAIDIFKPITVSYATSEKYFIGLQRRSDDVVNMYVEMLKKVERNFISDKRFLKESLPDNFVEWLEESNNNHLHKEMELWEKIGKLKRGEKVDIHEYNLRTALKVWSLPGNIPKERELRHI